jgi:hypothetical protein
MAENANNFELCVKRAGKEEASGFEACLMTEADNKAKSHQASSMLSSSLWTFDRVPWCCLFLAKLVATTRGNCCLL